MSSLQWLTKLFKKDDKSSKKSTRSSKSQKKKAAHKRTDQLILDNISAQFFFLQGSGSGKYDCQDTYGLYAKSAEDFSFYAVFDGHGASGKEASNTACDFMLSYVDKHYSNIMHAATDNAFEGILHNMFIRTDESLKALGIDMDLSGTTCVCILAKDANLYVASVGDSRAVLARIANGHKFAIELTQDHRPYVEKERARIIKHGGYLRRIQNKEGPVGPYRIWSDEDGPGLAITRSLGDFSVKKIGMTSNPQIQRIHLKDADQFVVIATDGLWEVMSSTEVVAFIVRLGDERNQAARQLVVEARNIWHELNRIKRLESRISDSPSMRYGIDDISVIILFFTYEGIEPYFSPKNKEALLNNKFLKDKPINIKVDEAIDTKNIEIKDISQLENSVESHDKPDHKIGLNKVRSPIRVTSNPATPKRFKKAESIQGNLNMTVEESPHSLLDSIGKQTTDFRKVPQSFEIKEIVDVNIGIVSGRDDAEANMQQSDRQPLASRKRQEGLIPVEYDLECDVDLEDDLLPSSVWRFTQVNNIEKTSAEHQGYKNESKHRHHPSDLSSRPLNEDMDDM